MKRERINKIFQVLFIILSIFVIVNFVLYRATDKYTRINWEYVYTPEKADVYLIPFFIGLAILLLVLIIYLVIHYRQESKLPGFNIFRNFSHRQKARKLKTELEIETKIAIPPAERKFSRFGIISEQLDLSQQKLSVTTKDETTILLLDSLIYDEKILNERCGICKLTFNQGQLAIFCPRCETLFHKDHISDWLETANHCPVCKFKFVK